MRTFDQLIGPEQEAAVDHCLGLLLTSILEGAFRFSDAVNGDNLQEAIDAALAEAERMQTPWFAGEYIMEARFRPIDGHVTEADGRWPVAELLRGFARCQAEDAQYADADDGPIFRLTGTLEHGFKVGAA